MTTPEPEGVSVATMPLSSHLRELRTRLMWTFIVVGIGAIGAFAIGNRLVEVLLIPFPDHIEVVQIDILEGIRVRMKIALLGGIVVAFPMILYQAVMFVRPALSRTEKTFLYVSLPITSGLFIGGILFAFFVPIPVMMRILPEFLGDDILPQIRVESIVGTTVWLIFAMGLLFENTCRHVPAGPHRHHRSREPAQKAKGRAPALIRRRRHNHPNRRPHQHGHLGHPHLGPLRGRPPNGPPGRVADEARPESGYNVALPVQVIPTVQCRGRRRTPCQS